MIIKWRNRAGVLVFKHDVVPEFFAGGKDGELIEAVNFYQKAVFDYPEIEPLLFHVVNEGRRTYQTGQLLKQSGMKKGVSDYILLKPSGKYSYACIEIKRADGGNGGDKEQKSFILDCEANGGFACIANGEECAMAALKEYLIN
tara:strand:- start:9915 stop:10346 length:432 start_codon:yes stop_codon:yes gene_type:complete